MNHLFNLGQCHATPGALELIDRTNTSVHDLLARHVSGDWGDALCAEDKQLNDQSVLGDGRILSAYRLGAGADIATVWIITEWDRSATTVLLPEEY